MSVQVDMNWEYHGMRVIRIENSRLRVDVLPALGGKVLNLVDKVADRNVLWQSPRIPPHPAPLQANFDDHYAGGWDDGFPTCVPCKNEYDDAIPYLGEVWNLDLSACIEEAGPSIARVRLDGATPITPAGWSRTITLEDDSPSLRLDTSIKNSGTLPFAFNWGTHAAVSVEPGDQIDVPATSAMVSEAGGGGGLGVIGDEYEYPYLLLANGETVDVRRVQERSAGSFALHVFNDMTEGWIAVTSGAKRAGFGLVFDPTVQTSAWQWMNYGGFRGAYHAIIEAWLSPAASLDAALSSKTAKVLQPGECFSSVVHGVVYSGVESVTALSADGSVH
ncbi:aldose epimerase family protein [Rathayibacter soli]|uniref:hypothetical protein n=1 Tax=Rathayibacter soli TaxID=3144168 RepID=UPI0027E3F3A4|nr:hypothetical protein [Glaciibacter superstes]